MPNKRVFSASAVSLQEEMPPEGEKGMSMGGTHLTRESSKIHTLATHGRKWCPGPQNRAPWSQNGAQWSQNEPTIVANVTNVIWHGGGSGSACDSGLYIYIYIYICFLCCGTSLQKGFEASLTAPLASSRCVLAMIRRDPGRFVLCCWEVHRA